jgi:hypothetical protein
MEQVQLGNTGASDSMGLAEDPCRICYQCWRQRFQISLVARRFCFPKRFISCNIVALNTELEMSHIFGSAEEYVQESLVDKISQ